MNALLDYFERHRRAAILKHVRGKLLDIGCGKNRLVRQYGNGTGVDVYNWGDVDIIVKDSSRLPFDDRAFDTISFVACLNHIPNRRDVLSEAHRVLKSNGCILITMIPPRLSAALHKIIAPWDDDQHERGMKPGEVYGLTTGEIAELLQQTGFTLAKHERFLFKLNHLYIGEKNETRKAI